MWRVTCKLCGTIGFTFDGLNPQTAINCDCCSQGHDHDAAANSCSGAGKPRMMQHISEPCTHPIGGRACDMVTPLGAPCPGGHCFPGVPDCTVCRPINIQFEGNLPLGPDIERIP